MSYNLPIFFATQDGLRDVRIGKFDYVSPSSLPVPIPPEFWNEFSGQVPVRNVEVFKTNDFRVLDYGGGELMIVDPTGNTRVQGTFEVTGNQIKSSGGTTAIELSGPNVQLKGNVQISGNISSPTGTNNFTGNITASGSLVLGGTISASTKFFDIPHPSKPGMRLRYGTLEGPENAVFLRGKSRDPEIILPEYWKNLVDLNTVSVHVSPTITNQRVSAIYYEGDTIYVDNNNRYADYSYLIIATRKDIEPLTVEYAEA